MAIRHIPYFVHRAAVRTYGGRGKTLRVEVQVSRFSGSTKKGKVGRGAGYSAGACVMGYKGANRARHPIKCTGLAQYASTPTAAVKKALATLARELR